MNMSSNLNKRCILYFPYTIDFERQSASSIRPQKIIESFKVNGPEPFIISGSVKERKKLIKELKEMINDGIVFDFVYSESSTMPLMLTETHHLPLHPFVDSSFFRFCKKQGIKIGLFYRDVQWRFPFYDKAVSKPKALFAKAFYTIELALYKKYLDVLYLPSLKMLDKIPELKTLTVRTLPPALDDIIETDVKMSIDLRKIRFFYAGGIMNIYNLDPTIELLNKNNDYHLTLVCRQEEWDIMSNHYMSLLNNPDQISIHHIGRSEIPEVIQKTDFALFVMGKQEYLDFAIPFKIFDYIQYVKPVLTLNGTAVSEMVQSQGIGMSKETVDELNEYLNHLNDEEYEKLVRNISASRDENTWSSRIKQIVKDLN